MVGLGSLKESRARPRLQRRHGEPETPGDVPALNGHEHWLASPSVVALTVGASRDFA